MSDNLNNKEIVFTEIIPIAHLKTRGPDNKSIETDLRYGVLYDSIGLSIQKNGRITFEPGIDKITVTDNTGVIVTVRRNKFSGEGLEIDAPAQSENPSKGVRIKFVGYHGRTATILGLKTQK